MARIGIIGFGAFGRLAAREIARHAEVVVTDARKSLRKEAGSIPFVSLQEAASSSIVLLAVPINKMEPVLKQVRPYLREDALVMDACSVKAVPCRLMRKLLPKDVSIVGTHPLFGPQSVKSSGLKGKAIVVTAVRADKRQFREAVRFIRKHLGIRIIEMTPEEHDRAAARQALTHLLCEALERIGYRKNLLPMQSTQLLVGVMDLLKDDSRELLRDLFRFNPYARSEAKKLVGVLQRLDEELTA